MNNFQSQLDKELEQRGLKPIEESAPETKVEPKPKKEKKLKKEKVKKQKKEKKEKKPKKAKLKKTIPFSFKSFFIALSLGVLIFVGVFIWLIINADKTAENFISNLPTKTAIVNREVDPIITTEDVQPVLRMMPVEQEEPVVPEKATQTNDGATSPSSNDNIAPITGLYQSTDYGLLPIKNKETGMTPFKAYKKQASINSEKPLIAFVVVNMGINEKVTHDLIGQLPENITLSFSPYAWNVKALMMKAQQAKHETWMTLPLQTKDYPQTDPGPLAILNGTSIKQNQTRLNTLMGKAVGYAGFIAEKDHDFRTENSRTNPIFKDIFNRGLAIIDSNDNAINFVARIAKKGGHPHGQNNFWLDDDLRPLALNQKLRQALEQSRNNGKVTVMLHPYPASIKVLKKFLGSVAAQEFNILPASALVTSE